MIKTQQPKYLAKPPAEVIIDMTPPVPRIVEFSEQFGGSCVQVTLSSGRVVLVWDVSVEDETKACIQVYDNLGLIDEGAAPNQEVLL